MYFIKISKMQTKMENEKLELEQRLKQEEEDRNALLHEKVRV